MGKCKVTQRRDRKKRTPEEINQSVLDHTARVTQLQRALRMKHTTRKVVHLNFCIIPYHRPLKVRTVGIRARYFELGLMTKNGLFIFSGTVSVPFLFDFSFR